MKILKENQEKLEYSLNEKMIFQLSEKSLSFFSFLRIQKFFIFVFHPFEILVAPLFRSSSMLECHDKNGFTTGPVSCGSTGAITT